MDLSIIIVNWNSKEYLWKCLTSVFEHTTGMEFEVIVIDSGSFDGCGEMIAREFPAVRFIQSRENLGFARANNAAFEQARGRNLLFLNPDTEVTDSAIKSMMEQLEVLPGAGAVGCTLLNSDGTLQTSCIQSFPTVLNQVLDSEFLRNRFPQSRLWGIGPLFSRSMEAKTVQAISGACVMVKRAAFELVGRFETLYFMYGEDIDLSLKLDRAGLKRYYIPSAKVVHHGGGSSHTARSSFSVIMVRESFYALLKLRNGRVSAWLYRAALGISAIFRLPLIAGLAVTKRKAIVGDSSLRKWISILRWSLGFERWASVAPSGR